ncbi:NAD(P)/FAD-dependent oxidoreductase [Luteimonas composti]|uniref:Protein CbrA n=1 Tax=Luteimonas composti TaxID=398257 RepID=A0ABT6MQL8_9GAMM|nr:NAD(P)/FAD-dependent oxidoreductase [Luteimonas composti]MDH7452739.1 NAD(P)/FAD-dependent oxidoreductase [Luteimonas composti]
MRCSWDVVVVGASFAGAACALAAREAGLRVCVLERKRDPGIRLHTTGIIVREAAEGTALAGIPPALVRRVDGVRLYAPGLRSVALQRRDYYFLATDTPAVMRWLAGELERAGVELRLMQSFTDARRDGEAWQVAGLGACRWLVGADGAKSRVAMRAGLGRVRDFLYGVEHEFDGATLAEPDRLHCFIDRALAPGYVGWAAQNPRGVQLGLAFRHREDRAGVPDIDAFRRRVGERLGLDPGRRATATRAGLIPCGGPVRPLAAPGVILTGDAAGIVSPVTAGGIHSAWRHGEAVGRAIAAHLLAGGPDPGHVAARAAPRYRGKRLLRWAYDHLQQDWPFDLLLGTPPLRWAAERIYFHARPRGAR